MDMLKACSELLLQCSLCVLGSIYAKIFEDLVRSYACLTRFKESVGLEYNNKYVPVYLFKPICHPH